MAARSKASVSGRLLAGIAGSNHAGGMDVCFLCVLCVVRQRSLRRDDHSSCGVLPIVACLNVRDIENSTRRKPRATRTVNTRGI